MTFATLAVKTLLEQAHFGFKVNKPLVKVVIALLKTCGKVGLKLGELFFEFGFAKDSALVKRFIISGLLARVSEGELTSR
jgi:hypothetical protein